MKPINYNFTSKRISPWGGLRLVQEIYMRIGLRDRIKSLDLPYPRSNRGYDPADILEGFMISIILGARRLYHTGSLRYDEVIAEIFGWKKGMASSSTFSRFFNKMDMATGKANFIKLQKWWFELYQSDKLTIDIDSKVIQRYGEQGGVAKGYKGYSSHHPLIAFVSELNMVGHAQMRKGNSTDLSDFEIFFEELVEILGVKKIGLVRMDAGFYGKSALKVMEKHGVNYILGAHLKKHLINEIAEQREWLELSDDKNPGTEYCAFNFKARGWEKERRVLIIRKNKKINPKARGKLLFPDIEEFENYTYNAYVTNLELSGELLWGLYKKRANCENKIKELIHDFGIEAYCMHSFDATFNVFAWTMIAYNLMALFKQEVMKANKKIPMLSTVNFQCIALGSYISKSGRTKTLNLAARKEKRRYLEKLFKNASHLKPPFLVPNA